MSIVIICRVSCSSNVCVCVCVCYILPTSRLIVNLKRIVRRVESLLHLIPPSLRTPRCQREKLPLRNRHRRQRVPLVTLRLRNKLKRIIQMPVLICSFLRAQQLPQRPRRRQRLLHQRLRDFLRGANILQRFSLSRVNI